ncbi:hypothetical protein KJ765_05940 [Candidatus Micrarchaeota archaeon]|nr:hypothetical protein [Candidatus Micrarchaeota archaeon]
MVHSRTALSVTLERLGGLLVFLILLAIANWRAPSFPHPLFLQIIWFLNQNLLLLLGFSFLLYLGELFGVFPFPFNLPSPLFHALGGALFVYFVFNIMGLAESLSNRVFMHRLLPFMEWAILAVFLIILLVGYAAIFYRAIHPHGVSSDKTHFRNKQRHGSRRSRSSSHSSFEERMEAWGDEVEDFFNHLGKEIREVFKEKK